MINYHRFIDHIFKLLAEFNHIALLVAGHPRLGVTFIELLKKTAPTNIDIEIIDGISSFDVMSTQLDLDPLEQGTALIDVNRLLLFEYTLEPSLGYFIYHICSVGNTETNFENPSINNRFDLLKDYLLKFYKQDKKVYFCRVSSGVGEISNKIETTLENFESFLSEIDFATTLYIPAEKPNGINWDFLNILRPSSKVTA